MEKQIALGEVSYLEQIRATYIAPIWLNKILGGTALIIQYRIALGGIALNIISLLNLGAGGDAFIHSKLRLIIKR